MTERLSTQAVENRMVSALSTIEALWGGMLTPPARRPGTRTHGTGADLPDNAEAADDTPRMVQVIDARREIMLTLRSWCQVTVEDHHVEHGIPEGQDVPGMARFLTRWSYLLAEHEAALDLLAEVETARAEVEKWAPPASQAPAGWAPRPRSMRLGACPLTWQHPETADDQPCPGTLRGHEDGWVRCDTCGTQAVMGWWEKLLHGEAGIAPMTIEGVRAYLYAHHGMRITRRGVQAWVDRGHLVASGSDGITALYDLGAVEAALTRRQRISRTGP